jgi:hypothetical protein
MPIPFAFGNRYIMTFIDDNIGMCWVYLLKHKSQAFETLKNFHLWIENEAQYRIDTLCTDNGGNILLMSLKTIFSNMGSNIKPFFHTILSRMV